ncbi:MAG: Arc family DNA binding domain-containing protein [Hyphomicrobiales bacterium]
MSGRKAFLLRIDPDLWRALEAWAADELRSVNGQIEYLLSRAVRDAGRARRPRAARPPGRDAGPKPD